MWVIVYTVHGELEETLIEIRGDDFYYFVDKMIKEAKEYIRDLEQELDEIIEENINHLRWTIRSNLDIIITINAKYFE